MIGQIRPPSIPEVSNLSKFETDRLVEFADSALRGSQFGRDDGDVDRRAAAIALTAEWKRRRWPDGKSMDATRKLIERVLDGRLNRVRASQGTYLLNLIRCLGRDIDASAEALRLELLLPSGWQAEWFYPATWEEAESLRLPTWDIDEAVCWVSGRHPAVAKLAASRASIVRRVRLAKRLLGAVPSDRLRTMGEKQATPLAPAFLGALDALVADATAARMPYAWVMSSIQRALGPLCLWYRSGGSFVGWHEMTRAQQKNVLGSLINAERVFLGLSPFPRGTIRWGRNRYLDATRR